MPGHRARRRRRTVPRRRHRDTHRRSTRSPRRERAVINPGDAASARTHGNPRRRKKRGLRKLARGTATSRIIMSGSDYDEDVEDMENESASEEEQSLEDQLIEAAAAGRLIEVDRLLAEGVVDVDGTSNLRDDRSRALHLSCTFGRPLVTNSLIRAGADVNATNEGGDTPLILASLNGHGSIVEALLKAGANVHATDQFGE